MRQDLRLPGLGGRFTRKSPPMHAGLVEAILRTVPSEACVFEDLCQWRVTPGRSTQAGLVEGDRP